jgi:hypothetical protein
MNGSEVEGTYHLHHLGVYIFSNNVALRCDVLQHLVQSLGLDLFPFQFGVGVVKIKQDRALMKLLDEELWPLSRRRLCAKKKISFRKLRVATINTQRTHKGG